MRILGYITTYNEDFKEKKIKEFWQSDGHSAKISVTIFQILNFKHIVLVFSHIVPNPFNLILNFY